MAQSASKPAIARFDRRRHAATLRRMDPGVRQRYYEAEFSAGRKAGHEPINIGTGMSDQYACSCKWVSPGYNDGAEYAHEDWVNHLVEAGVEIRYPDGTIRSAETCGE